MGIPTFIGRIGNMTAPFTSLLVRISYCFTPYLLI